MFDERVAPLLVLGKGVVAEVQVLNLRTILVNHLHQIGQVPPMHLNVAQAELLDLRHVLNHALEALHEDDLVDLDIREAEARHTVVGRLGKHL